MIKLGIVIGRFQPFDMNHQKLIEHALGINDQVLILLGSSVKPRNALNPFTIDDRERMISKSIGSTNIYFDYLIDYLYNGNRWLTEVQSAILNHMDIYDEAFEVTLYGNNNMAATGYIDQFPQWKYEYVDAGKYPTFGPLGFTSEKLEKLFVGDSRWKEDLSSATIKFISNWIYSDEGRRIFNEFEYLQTYRRNTQTGRYETVFHTVDAVTLYKGNILLVERRSQPGRGLWALPGGFLNPREHLFDGVIRELEEETTFRVNPAWLSDQHTFDHPYRSLRGRTITQAYRFDVPDYKDIPVVIGKDDAKRAQWFPLAEVLDDMATSLFEDHYDIISHFVE